MKIANGNPNKSTTSVLSVTINQIENKQDWFFVKSIKKGVCKECCFL